MKNLIKLPGIQKILKAKDILSERINLFMPKNLITIMKKLSMITLIEKENI